jgi:hypothetical protein
LQGQAGTAPPDTAEGMPLPLAMIARVRGPSGSVPWMQGPGRWALRRG